jgi:hypothetical protein
MQTVMFCEDLHRGLTAIRSHHPDILRQGHHGIRRQLVDLDLELRRTSATNRCAGRQRPAAKKTSKTTNSPSGSGTSSAPGHAPLRCQNIQAAAYLERGPRKIATCPTPRRTVPLFIHRTRHFGKPAVQQYRIRQRSHQKPPRNHFERGQRLHHLATSLAPDDLVELVPRRANVGAKAKTLPFARCLRQSRCTNGGEMTGGFHPSTTTLQDEGLRRGRPRLASLSNTKAHEEFGPM